MFPDRQLDTDRDWLIAEFGATKARTILYEQEYYNLHGELPPDAVVIERVEWINGSALIIHADPDALRQ